MGKYVKMWEEISADKVLSAEDKQSKNVATSEKGKGVTGEVNQYGFDCVYLTYKGLQSGHFKAKGSVDKIDLKSMMIIDVDASTNHIDSKSLYRDFEKEDIVKVIKGDVEGLLAVFLKNKLCFKIPGTSESGDQYFRGWIRTNDRTKVVGFLKKWDLFNKVNINDIMLLGDKMERLKNLKVKTGELKAGKKKPTVDDVKKILGGESENKAEEIFKLFQ